MFILDLLIDFASGCLHFSFHTVRFDIAWDPTSVCAVILFDVCSLYFACKAGGQHMDTHGRGCNATNFARVRASSRFSFPTASRASPVQSSFLGVWPRGSGW